MVNGVKPYYEEYHKVYYSGRAIKAMVKILREYIPEQKSPGKDINILDTARAYCRLLKNGRKIVRTCLKSWKCEVK